MKHALLLLFLFSLSSCAYFREIATEQAQKLWEEKGKPAIAEKVDQVVKEKAPQLLAAIDTNKNGKVDFDELKVNLKDPAIWTSLLSLLTTFLTARGSVKRDDQHYDSIGELKVALAKMGITLPTGVSPS